MGPTWELSSGSVSQISRSTGFIFVYQLQVLTLTGFYYLQALALTGIYHLQALALTSFYHLQTLALITNSDNRMCCHLQTFITRLSLTFIIGTYRSLSYTTFITYRPHHWHSLKVSLFYLPRIWLGLRLLQIQTAYLNLKRGGGDISKPQHISPDIGESSKEMRPRWVDFLREKGDGMRSQIFRAKHSDEATGIRGVRTPGLFSLPIHELSSAAESVATSWPNGVRRGEKCRNCRN